MFVDMHNHILYGVDDGARSFEQMTGMLDCAIKNGVSDLVATPHAIPGRKPFPLPECLERLSEANAWCEQSGAQIRLHLGAEIFYTDDTVRLLDERRIPTLAETTCVLVEFSPDAPYSRLTSAARELGGAGYTAVYAHIERYRCLRPVHRVQELRDQYDVRMQVNANTLINRQSLGTRLWLKSCFKAGLIDLASSDAHNTSARRCRMRDCYQALLDAYAEETARYLCHDCASELLEL